MIASWRLKNFKSVAEEQELEFLPLTIFAGANNSGKSTIIQSILLTTQTIQSAVLERPVVLNGHMARLGSFTDIVAGANEESNITVGFSLSFPDRFRSGIGRRGTVRTPYPYYVPRSMSGPMNIACDYYFSMKGESRTRDVRNLQPRLEGGQCSVQLQTEESEFQASMRFHRSEIGIKERLKNLNISTNSEELPEPEALRYELGTVFPPKWIDDMTDLARAKGVGVHLRHFLPYAALVSYDRVETEVRRIADALTAKGSLTWRELDEELDDALESQEVRRLILSTIHHSLKTLIDKIEADEVEGLRRRNIERRIDKIDQYMEELESSFSGETLRRFIRYLPPTWTGHLAQSFDEIEDDLRRAVRAGRGPEIELTGTRLPKALHYGLRAVPQFFGTSVHYLGPLRDEPKPVYPLAGATDPTDVGLRGEYTASVLDVNRHVPVQFIPPQALDEEGSTAQPVQKNLSQAVLEWLNYMGVGIDLQTVDRGKLGHELKVATTQDAGLHDLTQVGVGVSQVLPILVLSLLADTGSTLIFEQPELHLHPKVQSRLADFFLSLVKIGKQCIVETHSEYLINRIRYRAAVEEKSDSTVENVRIFFVEKEGAQSIYRSIEINEYGVIEDWPDGFFDEKDTLAAATLRAGMAKRRRDVDRKREESTDD